MLDAMQKTTEDAEKESPEQLESLEDCAKKTVLAAKLCRAPDLLVRPSGCTSIGVHGGVSTFFTSMAERACASIIVPIGIFFRVLTTKNSTKHILTGICQRAQYPLIKEYSLKLWFLYV